MNPERRPRIIELRNACLCGLAVVVAVILTNPISESPFNDDWSYAQTVKILHETGKLTYNGWAAASVIAQAYWGLLWVKLFGFSYTTLRLSTLQLAAGAISLCYLLGRRVGLQVRYAVFAALLVGLSPMFLPLADSFMTDAPGMFFMFLSMYLLVRSIESPGARRAVAWLSAGLVVGLIGGTSRQIVWVVPLVVGPYAAWVRRGDLAFVVSAVLGSAIVLGGAVLSMRWFAHQPFSIPESSLKEQLHAVAGKPAHFLLKVLAMALTLLWMILPAMWAYVRGSWNNARAVVAFVLLLGTVLILAKTRPTLATAPWMINTITHQGVMGGAELSSPRPIAIPMALRIFFGMVVLSVGCVVIADLLIWLARPLRAFDQTIDSFFRRQPNHKVLPAMLLFAAAYFTLLLPRTATDQTYDRYVLPLMPCALFPLLLKYQQRGDKKIPAASWVLLSFYALAAIVFTQDVIALDRARSAAANRLIAAGIPRTRIDGGFEYNYETQVITQGHINDHRLKNPPGSYNKNLSPIYSVSAEYRIEYAPGPDTTPTKFGSVSYISFLYPFHRKIYINRFTNPTWLVPHGKAQAMPQSANPDDAALH